MGLTRPLLAGATAAGVASATYVGLVTGRLTVDLRVARRTRALGPLTVDIAAPRDVVYAVTTAPYAERRARAIEERVQILDRAEGMVLAAHRTPVRKGLTAVTVETVTFRPPARVGFRLVRGPVPLVTEVFDLTETPQGTRLGYSGVLGTDLGPVGAVWGRLVARTWVAAVQHSLDEIRTESERRGREPSRHGR